MAALAFLVAYALPALDGNLAGTWVALCVSINSFVWLIFLVDYGVRLVLARFRFWWIRRNLLDLAVILLPMLQPLRLPRLVFLFRVLNRRAENSMRGRITAYVATSTGLLIFSAALAVLDAERGAKGANITNFGDAVWWAVTTMSTVGYGDEYPVTTTGRLVAVALMIGGVALLGVVTASLASWVIDHVQESDEEQNNATRADIAALRGEISELRAELARRDVLTSTSAGESNGSGG